MLPTPDTSHVPYERVYEPAEDSFLLLDTLSSDSETAFLTSRFSQHVPFVVEIGTGSGVVIGFTNAHAKTIFGTRNVLTAGIDMNAYACRATLQTAQKASKDNKETHGRYLDSCMGDLTTAIRSHEVDVLIFNPPYVPTEEMPLQPESFTSEAAPGAQPSFDDESYLLALSYAGGKDGMETTDRLIAMLPDVLSAKGCAYILLCASNKPEEVKLRLQGMGAGWNVATVGSSGKTGGRENLQIVRIWRDETS